MREHVVFRGPSRGGRRRPQRVCRILALLAALLSACTEEATEPAPAPPAAAGSEAADPLRVDTGLVDQLRALGYVEVAPPLAEGAPVGVIRYDPEKATPGLNLFTNSHNCSAQIVDMEGEILHQWSGADCFRWANTTLLPNGDLLIVGRRRHDKNDAVAAARARFLMRQSWDGEVLWTRDMPTHHDAELTPEGLLATLTYRHVLDPELDPEIPLRENFVALTTPEGELVEEISIREVLEGSPEIHEIQLRKARRFEGSQELDLFHANSVEFMRYPELEGKGPLYAPSNVLVTLREQDATILFDWKTKKLLWSWGPGVVSGPHDSTMLRNGNILVFDNGRGRHWSRVLEVEPASGEIVWEYHAPDRYSFYTITRGSAQRLESGNTLIAESGSGRAFEVTPEGEIVWEFLNPNLTRKREPLVIVRMRRYEGLDFATLQERVAAGRLEMPD